MLPMHRPQRNWGARVHDGHLKGLHAVVLENELLRISVLAGKGTDIVEVNYKPLDLDFTWLTPGGVRNPTSYLTSSPDAFAPYLDNYPGGWQEIFPNGGIPSFANGANYGQHAEVFALPWDVQIVEDDEAAVAVRFTVRAQKTAARIEKTLRIASGASSFQITERLVNESDVSIEAMWGHHITYGAPFMKAGCKVTVPDGLELLIHPMDGPRRIDPRATPSWPVMAGGDGAPVDLSVIPEHGSESEMLYLSGFVGDEAWYRIEDEERGVGARVSWDARQMPYLWFWQELGAGKDYPWYGRANVVGLEPFSSLPTSGIPGAIKNQTAITLAGREVREFWLNYEVVDRNR